MTFPCRNDVEDDEAIPIQRHVRVNVRPSLTARRFQEEQPYAYAKLAFHKGALAFAFFSRRPPALRMVG